MAEGGTDPSGQPEPVKHQCDSQFANGKYKCNWTEWTKPSALTAVKWSYKSLAGFLVKEQTVTEEQLDSDRLEAVNLKALKEKCNNGISVTWFGHASLLVQMEGLNILTDPVWSNRASFTQSAGFKRYRQVPCKIEDEDFPVIDAVVISHNHYDHLDVGTVTSLNAKSFGDNIHWFVPSGLSQWMKDTGCKTVTELGWWKEGKIENCEEVKIDKSEKAKSEDAKIKKSEEAKTEKTEDIKSEEEKIEKTEDVKIEKGKEEKIERSNVKFVFTPAQHWSGRGVFDTNMTLWGSWCIIGEKTRFFFAGDTGYHENLFREIGENYGPFDLAALPIGSYLPRDMMKEQHIDPAEAVKIHKHIQAKSSLGIHWGTFALSSESYLVPKTDLGKLLELEENREVDFFLLKHGETRTRQTEEERAK